MNSENLEEYSIRWSGHIQHVKTAFNNLLESNELCDVTLYIEGKRIHAHKVLLSACSKYFEKLFKDFRDERPIIVLKGVQYNILKQILSFIYKGEVNVETEQLNQFLEAAAFLKVDGLIEHYNKRKRETTTVSDCDNVSVGSEPEHTPSPKRGTIKRFSKSLVQKQPRYKINSSSSNKEPVALCGGKKSDFTKPPETGKYSIDSPNRVGEWLSDYEFVSQSSNVDSHSPYHENTDDIKPDIVTNFLPPIENTDNANTGPKTVDLLYPKTEMETLTDTENEISFNQDEFANSLDEEIEVDGDGTDGSLEKQMMKTPLAFLDEEGLYECKICGKSYVRKDSLKKHFAVHVNNTTCMICNKTMSRKTHLVRHLKTHGIGTVSFNGYRSCQKCIASGKYCHKSNKMWFPQIDSLRRTE